MSFLGLMPFPALHPLNWWALASPRNAMLASVNNAHLMLDAWRAGADSLRAILRQQQDETLRLMEAPLEEAGEQEATRANGASEEAEPTKSGDAETAPTAALLVQPMIEMTRAYGRVGRAFIVAQRDTMRAFTEQTRPH